MATLFQLPRTTPLVAGESLPLAKAYFFQSGTLNPITVWTSSDLDVEHSSPIQADSDGIFPSIYIDEDVYASYRLQVTTSADVQHYDEDNIPTRASSETLADEVIQQLYPQSAAEIAASVTPTSFLYPPLDVRRYGAVADGATDCQQAVTDAISVAVSMNGAAVNLPAGTLRFESNLSIRDNITLLGHGNGTVLEFNGCSLLLDADNTADDIDSRHLTGFSLENIRVKRIGTAGYAVKFVSDGGTGASDNRDVVRFNVRGLYVISSTGGGIQITGTYLGAFYNTYVRQCEGTAISIEQQSGTNVTAGNALAFFGGEVQSCNEAASLTRCLGVAFYGMTFEGNDEGIEVFGGKALTFDGCYFESNGTTSASYDFQIGNAASQAPNSMVIRGCHFVCGSPPKNYAIDLIRATQIRIESCNFQNYTVAAINRNGASSTSVTGRFLACVADGTTPALVASENFSFHQDPDERVIVASQAWTPSSINNGAQEQLDATVTGAVLGDFVEVAVSAAISTLKINAHVHATNTVRLTLSNSSGSTVSSPGARTFYIKVYPKAVWGF